MANPIPQIKSRIHCLPKVEINPKSIFTCKSVEQINGSLVANPFQVPKFVSPRKVFRPNSYVSIDFKKNDV